MTKNSTDRHVFPVNMIRLCIDGYDGDIEGRIYSKLNKEAIAFDNCCEMLIKTDEMFEKAGYPQSFCDERSFVSKNVKGHYELPGEALVNDEYLQKQKGQLCTLEVLIRSRKHASWQGCFKLEDNVSVQEFSCVIELLRNIGKIVRNEYKTQTGDIR